ncbi:aminopeptidase P . Metallo peptidase. MEROPS family M24B [Modicisalibacter muralis]|uniref:Xaa-Pro aminopeptidase n=1 Tax=Modicisalibacter muralis TaxID=119000 RepID=A0A1G9KYC3_9GAMM|nr:Xaa-Pro aminopeptidase [Halomonas muralis]SDL54850.1 aminopeptidase P . Metallo peptidase. MEROPS family M24B [Halomonas muralis]
MAHDILPRPAAIGLDEYRARREALMAALASADSAVLLPAGQLVTRSNDSDYDFRQNSDFHYLSGFPEPDALLVLLPGREAGETVLFCQDKDPAKEAWTGMRIGAAGAVEHYGIDQAFENAERDERLGELLDGRETLYLPLDSDAALAIAEAVRGKLGARVRQGARPPQAFADVARLVHEQRLIKSDAELALLRHAAEISARGHVRAMRTARPGLFEYHLQAELEHEFLWQGAAAPAYSTIVGGGANACVLHYIENDSPLAAGDLVLIDAGAEFDLYAGDITRTFPVNGHFSEAQRAVYEIVLAAQERAVAAVAPGVTLTDIHQGVVRDLTHGLIELGLLDGELEARIEDESYRRFYLHSTSHWLGLDVHDVGGYRHKGEPRRLLPGMVLTVEPGLYIPDAENIPAPLRGIGIRIEDDVAVTLDGHEVLSAAVPKRIAEIEALMTSR